MLPVGQRQSSIRLQHNHIVDNSYFSSLLALQLIQLAVFLLDLPRQLIMATVY